jgi:molecular chaperone HscB
MTAKVSISRSQTEQSHSLDWSSLINKAYKTLMVPLARAEYILQQNNIDLPQDNSSLDQKFLIEMMERNEAVEEASTKSDIDDLLAEVKNDIDGITAELDGALQSENFELAKTLVVRMKYMLSIKNGILDKAELLGITSEM